MRLGTRLKPSGLLSIVFGSLSGASPLAIRIVAWLRRYGRSTGGILVTCTPPTPSPRLVGQPGPAGVRCINEPGWHDRMKLADSTRRWYRIGYKRRSSSAHPPHGSGSGTSAYGATRVQPDSSTGVFQCCVRSRFIDSVLCCGQRVCTFAALRWISSRRLATLESSGRLLGHCATAILLFRSRRGMRSE